MTSYWVIVPRESPTLYLALSGAYLHRKNHTVILDRRGTSDRRREVRQGRERRLEVPCLDPFAIVRRNDSAVV